MIFTLGLAIALSVGAQTASKTFSVRGAPRLHSLGAAADASVLVE